MFRLAIFCDFDLFGGTRTYLLELLKLYKEKNFQIFLFLPKKVDADILIEFQRLNIIVIKNPFKYFEEIKLFKFFPVSLILNFLEALFAQLKIQPDGVTISTGNPTHFLGIPLFFSHSLLILHTYPHCSNKQFLSSSVIKAFIKKNKRILTVSHYSKNMIEQCWNPKKKYDYIHFIHNFSIFEDFHTESSNIDTNKPIKILTIGHVEKYKNPNFWINIALQISQISQLNCEFLWIGDGTLLESCRNLLKEHKTDRIKFIGYRKDVLHFLKDCDIYFQPSIIESHGISVVDAMALGIPCVVTNVGGLPESVVNNQTGFFVDLDNPQEMRDKILLLINNKNLRESMGKSGRERYRDFFSKKKWKSEMNKVHEEIFGV